MNQEGSMDFKGIHAAFHVYCWSESYWVMEEDAWENRREKILGSEALREVFYCKYTV